MLFALLIRAINIPGSPRFSHSELMGKLDTEKSPFKTLAINPHGDTLVIRLPRDLSPRDCTEWVNERIDRQSLVLSLGIMPELYQYSIILAERSYCASFDEANATVIHDGTLWELGVVFSSLAFSSHINLKETKVVRILGRFGKNSFVIIKQKNRTSLKRSRIMWGEATRVVEKPFKQVLGEMPVCSSRAISAVKWLARQQSNYA